MPKPGLARRRGYKRASMLEAPTRELDQVPSMVVRGRLHGADAIGVRVGKVLDKHEMAKHLVLDIGEHHFEFGRNEETSAAEAAPDDSGEARNFGPSCTT